MTADPDGYWSYHFDPEVFPGQGLDPSMHGQAFGPDLRTVQATAAGLGRPAGTVTVDDGRGATCTDTTATRVDARTVSFSCAIRSAVAGTRTLTARFHPAAGWAWSSVTASHVVDRAATTTAITNARWLAANPTTVGQPYPVMVKVAVARPGAGTPGGTVTIGDGVATCTVDLSATGTASCELPSAATGVKAIKATYDGSTDSAPSSAWAVHRVQR